MLHNNDPFGRTLCDNFLIYVYIYLHLFYITYNLSLKASEGSERKKRWEFKKDGGKTQHGLLIATGKEQQKGARMK